jgi:hypothetical protein
MDQAISYCSSSDAGQDGAATAAVTAVDEDSKAMTMEVDGDAPEIASMMELANKTSTKLDDYNIVFTEYSYS